VKFGVLVVCRELSPFVPCVLCCPFVERVCGWVFPPVPFVVRGLYPVPQWLVET
jgi:hypothetical protein